MAYSSDPALRAARWRHAAGARLRWPRPPAWRLCALSWLLPAPLAVAALWGVAAWEGGPGGRAANLDGGREIPSLRAGTASASSEASAPPPGAPTRPWVPLYVGTQVLAPRGGGPWHQLAVVVRAEEGRGFVVYADGDSDWIRRALSPELAPGDAVQVWDGARFVPGVLRDRVGPALEVESAAGRAWTSAARVRVRLDAAHARGAGRRDPVPPGAWIDAQVGGAWRTGVAVRTEAGGEGGRLFVALSDGDARWVDDRDVRAQALGPGARVFLDAEPAPWIVAGRVGHALRVVGPGGERAWTALARARR